MGAREAPANERSLRLLVGLGVALAAAGASAQAQTLPDRYDLEQFDVRHDMPGRLNEISGLALTDDGRLFGHDDERAVIYEIDPTTGTVTRGFSLGADPVRSDFEAIAVVGERFFIASSTGALYEFREGPPESSVRYRQTDTGLGGRCEVEGLAYYEADGTLLVACKETVPDDGHVVIHRLPLDPTRGDLEPLRIPKATIRSAGGTRNFNPSALAVDPETGHLVLLAARQEQLLEVTASGEVVSVFRLSKSRHPRPEGLEFGPGGLLLIADERDEADARLTVYVLRSASPDSR